MSDFGYRLSKKVKVAVGAAKASKPSNGRPRKSNSRFESKEEPVHFESRQANDYDIERRRRFKMENSDIKRKRIFGGRSTEEDSSYSRNRERDRDGSFQRKRGLQGESSEEFIKDRSRKKELHSFRGKNELNLEGDRTWRKVRERVRSESVSDGKLKPKRRTAERRESVKGRVGSEDVFDGDTRLKTKATSELVSKKAGDSEDVLPKKLTRKKTNLNKEFDKGDSNRRQAGPFENSTRKMLRRKKDLEDEPETANGPSKKRKRIRLDPYDVSNKRLDDGISIEGNKIEKKVDVEEKPEVSKNAQFRAIQPNPSILSFVEDNLLGRRRLIELRRAGYNVDLSAPLDNIPFSTSSERERCEESVFRNKLAFFAAANVSSSFPPADLPEIAFAGRSNVGKSSLLNALTRQWGVVRTSDKPGLTQTINFFKLGSKHCLVDLPGYGFAYAKEEVKDAWEELVKEYVSTRVGLKRVCLLIDTKWGMKPRDHELINLMERSQTKYQIVLTKTDMVFPMDLARRAMQIEESLKANKSVVQPLMMVSSKSGAGIRSLRSVLSKISRFVKL